MARILIVDDDKDLIDGQRIFFESKGHEVATALSMKEGIEMLKTFRPDIILADLMMEHYDSGFVFSKKVKDDPEMKDIPIIMQTAAPKEIGYTFDPSNPKGKEWMKVDEVVVKPVPLDHLLGKVEQFLARGKKRG
jgi:CheY-like chemotaxis protein